MSVRRFETVRGEDVREIIASRGTHFTLILFCYRHRVYGDAFTGPSSPPPSPSWVTLRGPRRPLLSFVCAPTRHGRLIRGWVSTLRNDPGSLLAVTRILEFRNVPLCFTFGVTVSERSERRLHRCVLHKFVLICPHRFPSSSLFPSPFPFVLVADLWSVQRPTLDFTRTEDRHVSTKTSDPRTLLRPWGGSWFDFVGV